MSDRPNTQLILLAATTGYIKSSCEVALLAASCHLVNTGRLKFKRVDVAPYVSMTSKSFYRYWRRLREKRMASWDGDGLVQLSDNVWDWKTSPKSDSRVFAEGTRAHKVLTARLAEMEDVGTAFPAPPVPRAAAGEKRENRTKPSRPKKRPAPPPADHDPAELPESVKVELQKLETVKAAFARAFPND